MQANHLPIDYVGVGAIFATVNKQHVATLWGTHGLRSLSPHSKHPIVGIGGINADNAADVLASGADGIAVIGALHETENPDQVALALRRIGDKGGEQHVE